MTRKTYPVHATVLLLAILAAGAAGATVVSQSSSPGAFVADNGPAAVDTITIPDSGSILDVDVTVSVHAPEMADIVIDLTDPTGTVTVRLFETEAGVADALLDVTFDDEAAGPPPGFLVNGSCPQSVSYQPHTPLSDLDGLEVNGTWTLSVSDVSPMDASDCDCDAFVVGPPCPRTFDEWTITFDVADNQAPVAVCQDVSTAADPVTCTTAADVDGGSYDPDSDPIVLTQSPPGPYPLGVTPVTLSVEDDGGLSDSCSAVVTVVDGASPVVECNAPTGIVPPDAPIAFTATATDACGSATAEVTAFDCFKTTKKGKRIDKTGSCEVAIDGATVTILDSGGVGTTIEWTVSATDGSGNTIDNVCSVVVGNPGKS